MVAPSLALVLAAQDLVQSTVGCDRLVQQAAGQAQIMYGETYDLLGVTLDSLRYYFFTDIAVRSAREMGMDARGLILIGDKATAENAVNGSDRRMLLAFGEERMSAVHRVCDCYGLDLECALMSEIVHDPSFIAKKRENYELCRKDPQLLAMLEKSVPPAKLAQERLSNFSYSLDEITLITDKDLKIGPPREDVYDRLARQLASQQGARQLASAYLTPTFPLGKGWAFFFANPDLDETGVTAYKAGHRNLGEFRARLFGDQGFEQVRELIGRSYLPKLDDDSAPVSKSLPNPLLHLLQVGLFAKWHRTARTDETLRLLLESSSYMRRLGESGELRVRDEITSLLADYVYYRDGLGSK